ncbi:hypothetical protein ACSTJG_25445, partial [Vibrio parahaemolyticus]
RTRRPHVQAVVCGSGSARYQGAFVDEQGCTGKGAFPISGNGNVTQKLKNRPQYPVPKLSKPG